MTAPGAALLYRITGLMAWPQGIVPRLGMPSQQFGRLGLRGARMVFPALWGGFAIVWLLAADTIAMTLATVSGLSAFAVARDRHSRVFLRVSIVVSAAFSVFGQGFGGVLRARPPTSPRPTPDLLAATLLAATPRPTGALARSLRGEDPSAADAGQR